MPSPSLYLGNYPTAVEHIRALSTRRSELWVKRDDRTNAQYGGNKVRKLERTLAEAQAIGTKRIVTAGAAGSHHVFATAYFGKRAGIEVEAVLVPQRATSHVLEVLRADVAQGLVAFPVSSWSAAPFALLRRIASGATFLPVGGSSVTGSMGYLDAARELATQVRTGEVPEPDVCVVALGSGGTAAGLAAGFEAEGLKTRVVGVCVSQPASLIQLATFALARACARRAGVSATLGQLRRRLVFDGRFLGDGYGEPTADGEDAIAAAEGAAGLVLDPTYTAKAFAGALWQVRAARASRVLYWHTLSSAPMAPLLREAPTESALDPELRALVTPP
jgi:D-cysteine desulfhydrase